MTKVRPKRRKNLLKEKWNSGADNECFYCGDIVRRKNRSLDHLLPHSAGGSTESQNIVLACRACNNAKADLTLAEFVDFVAIHGGIQEVKKMYGTNSNSRKDEVRRMYDQTRQR